MYNLNSIESLINQSIQFKSKSSQLVHSWRSLASKSDFSSWVFEPKFAEQVISNIWQSYNQKLLQREAQLAPPLFSKASSLEQLYQNL
jgi:hypothetical protein